jgi:hypothetical protein
MDGNSWVDPRYAELVETWDQLKRQRQRRGGASRTCPACRHGLGATVMVDLGTKKPISIPCQRCSAD